ncbi:phosphate ABC transporter substrate-binding protein PstS [Halobacteriovorax sp. JY17]|uniref:phosphate ABC transporter substrate-binding protein PstS n=1 Tax=Halobacteriovorax sp. JY17 TaxID=2014617 RepID=UPI000C3B86E8|nr:phosphate ABC transporter substrate-binding protein PstS [Halobacteriovorax sp. JY17]PIK16294.1 MAG: phosphate ABC transporter substrate-binding protein PstS [Halobacteriovorax sp. JY17]
MKKFISLLMALLITTNIYAVTKVNGAGATFPYPMYSKWFSEYNKLNKDVQFNYQSIGSGGGIRQLIKQTVDFGASDAPMKEKDKKKAAWPVKHIPTILGAVSIAFNLEMSGTLKLDGATLSEIFMGSISKWDDERIKNLNPGLKLPNKDILVVRRADGSGTTSIFSDYLSTVSKKWEEKVGRGKSLKWPVGIGSKGNEGVTATIKQTDGAIGYVELAYALKNNLPTVALKNKAGEFTKPSVKGVSLSAATLDKNAAVTTSIVDAAGKGVYPISAFTYILLPVKKEDAQLKEVKKFLNWALTKGQSMAEELHYAPLPKSLATRMLNEIK